MRGILWPVALASVLLVSIADASPVAARAGKYGLEVSSVPFPPKSGDNTFTVSVSDAGKPVTGVSVKLHVDMVGMPMPADVQATPGSTAGQYVAPVSLGMAGKWKLTIAVQQMAGMSMPGDGEARFAIETDRSLTSEQGGAPSRKLVGVALVLAALIVLAFLLRRHGLPHGAKGVLAGLLTLVVVAVGTWWVVRRYRDPKVATVIGSALMDMDAMRATPSAIPVQTERVRPQAFQSKVTYTATVAADTEEEIYPRVTGRLVEMPLYPGDRVRAGQVVARLDTAELSAREAQAAAGHEMASRSVEAARAEVSSARAGEGRSLKAVEQARTQVQEALSGVDSAEGAVKAMEGELDQARESRREAESAVASAQSAVEQAQQMVVQAQGEVESAQAEVTYWEAEIARERTLFAKGAISKEELDRETSQAAAATAGLKQAQAAMRASEAGVTRARRDQQQAEARVLAAAAGVRTAEAKVAQARSDKASAVARVAQARAGVGTAQADVESASAGVRAAASKVGVASSQVVQARAAQTEAAVVRGYTVLRASRAGVVTARLVSPGVLVQPGTAILRLAKTDYVRVQAPLSEADLTRVHAGAAVLAWAADDPQTPLAGDVTTVFPARDSVARTGIVEARIENAGGRLVPGQTVRLEVSLGDEGSLLSVPTSALLVREGIASVFVAVQENGRLTARRVPVQTGGYARDRTQILSGLKSGAEVIVLGHDGLRDGDPVTVVTPQASPDVGGAAQPMSHTGHGE